MGRNKKWLLRAYYVLLLGVYACLRPFRDVLFLHFVDFTHIPYVRFVTLGAQIGLCYLSKSNKRGETISTLRWGCLLYGGLLFGNVLLMQSSFIATLKGMQCVCGYFWYVAAECLSALLIVSFWGLVNTETAGEERKKTIGALIVCGQIGGTLFPCILSALPFLLKATSHVPVCSFLGACFIMLYFFTWPLAHISSKKRAVQSEKTTCSYSSVMTRYPILVPLIGIQMIQTILITISEYLFYSIAVSSLTETILGSYLCIQGALINGTSILILAICTRCPKKFQHQLLFVMPLLLFSLGWVLTQTPSLTFFFAALVLIKGAAFSVGDLSIKCTYASFDSMAQSPATFLIDMCGVRMPQQVSPSGYHVLTQFHTSFFASLSMGVLLLPFGIAWLVCVVYTQKMMADQSMNARSA